MQVKLDFIANIRQWLVITILVFSHATYGSDAEPLDLYAEPGSYAESGPWDFQLPADELRQGCEVSFETSFPLPDDGSLGRPPHDIDVSWRCDDDDDLEEIQIIDTYTIEGVSPQIVTAFIRGGNLLIVDVKWSDCPRYADFCGDWYQIYIYQYVAKGKSGMFVKNHTLLANMRTGTEGVWKRGKKGRKKVTFLLKSKEAINAALDRLEK